MDRQVSCCVSAQLFPKGRTKRTRWFFVATPCFTFGTSWNGAVGVAFTHQQIVLQLKIICRGEKYKTR